MTLNHRVAGSNPVGAYKGLMAEWSKAIDLSSIIFGCAGSNPAGTNTLKIPYSKLKLKKKINFLVPCIVGFNTI